jgi:hypothetical protein
MDFDIPEKLQILSLRRAEIRQVRKNHATLSPPEEQSQLPVVRQSRLYPGAGAMRRTGPMMICFHSLESSRLLRPNLPDNIE